MTVLADSPVRALSARPHQEAAISAVADLYRAGAPRVQLRMACGSGKTLTSIWLAQRINARTIAVFAPSIGLVGQTIDAWRATGLKLRTLAVCSDPTTLAGRAEIGVDGIDPYRDHHDQAGAVTTQPAVVARFLDTATDFADHTTVVVSTYHSAGVIAAALRYTDRCRQFDLVIADEAHHLAGRTRALFVPVLRDDHIAARSRLFQTATPVIVGAGHRVDELSGASELARCMDDPRLFGPVGYTLSVGEAISAGLLANYRVVVTTPREGANTPEKAALGAVCDVTARYGVRRILTFHNRVAGAHGFAQRVNELGAIAGTRIRGFAIDGSMDAEERRRVLHELGRTDTDSITVVSSAQCLREGIDVPAVDAVVFADPRTSEVGIIQAIGRALRTHPDKNIGTIVVPLVLDPDADDQEQLADSSYRHVWRVLRGLRAHDARVGFDLDRARNAAGSGQTGAQPEWLEVLGDHPEAVVTRLLERTSAMWERYFGQLIAAVAARGSAALITSEGALGAWITLQRILFRDNTLDPERARRLEEVNGWRWEASQAADERSLRSLAAMLSARGSVAEVSSGASAYSGHRDGLNRPLRLWVAAKLFEYSDGVLAEWLRSALETHPGWSWTPLNPEDADGVSAYRSFVQWEGHTDIPADHVEDDVEVGRWLRGVRRRKVLGTLPPMVESMLLAGAPTTRNGDRSFAWKTGQAHWELGIDAARAYLSHSATLSEIKVGHTELVDGHPVDVYGWITRVRYRYFQDKLSAEQIAEVERFPGWRWRTGVARSRRVAVTEQPKPGVEEHNRRGYAQGCHCLACVTDMRSYSRQSAQNRRAAYRADWVEAGDVHRYLRSLVELDAGKDRSDATFTAGAIAAAAGVPLRLVSALLRDDRPRCHSLHRRALLATSADDVRAVRSVCGARGRAGIAAPPVDDPERIWSILDSLMAAGWTRQQLAAGLGYASASHVPKRGKPLSAAQARIVELFHESLAGDLTAPVVPPTARRGTGAVPAPSEVVSAEAAAWARALLEQGYQVPRVAQRSGVPVAIVETLAREL